LRDFPSPLPNLDHWLVFPLAPLKLVSPPSVKPIQRAEDTQTFQLGFLTKERIKHQVLVKAAKPEPQNQLLQDHPRRLSRPLSLG